MSTSSTIDRRHALQPRVIRQQIGADWLIATSAVDKAFNAAVYSQRSRRRQSAADTFR